MHIRKSRHDETKLVFEWEPGVSIAGDILAIDNELVDDYIFVENNINSNDNIDNLTILSEGEVSSPNNNKDTEIINDVVVKLGDASVKYIDTDNIESEIIERVEENINDYNIQLENAEEKSVDDTNILQNEKNYSWGR